MRSISVPCHPLALGLVVLLTTQPLRADDRLADTYRFLVSDREVGGVLFRASALALAGRRLPLSFHDSAGYWASEVCAAAPRRCAVGVNYRDWDHALEPEEGEAGDLLAERVMTHAGSNVYDAATWQVAVMLGALRGGFAVSEGGERGMEAAWRLVQGQSALLTGGHFASASHPVPDMIRARTAGDVFTYNGHRITEPRAAYVFRTLPAQWLSEDPFFQADAPPAVRALVTYGALPANAAYRPGLVSWSDWKPFTGENAWAFLLGPLQAARLYHEQARARAFVPFADPAVQNALPVLEAFSAMQAPLGGVYYAPGGTMENRGKARVDPRFVAVENTLSLTAGLRLLEAVLANTRAQDPALGAAEAARIDAARAEIRVLLHGGRNRWGVDVAGLLPFLRAHAWQDGEFVQGGTVAPDGVSWAPRRSPRAVDVNTWGIAVLGAATVDAWHGHGSAWRAWERVKDWGGYGKGTRLLGVGFSDIDGNGRDAEGRYRAGILSVEWTAGAITAVRGMIAHYGELAARGEGGQAVQRWLAGLREDEAGMQAGIERLRLDHHPVRGLEPLRASGTLPYLYADKRELVPFGWFANPLPSTCASAWRIMLAYGFDPFAAEAYTPR